MTQASLFAETLVQVLPARTDEIINVDGVLSKVCRKCSKPKPVSDFFPHYSKTGRQKFKSYCKPCHTAGNMQATKDRKQRDPSYIRLQTRKSLNRKYKKRYGITRDDIYGKLLVDQDGKCAICYRSHDQEKKCFAVDHDHATGQIRSLLCERCNRAIGLLQDNSIILRRAAEYLDAHSLRGSQ